MAIFKSYVSLPESNESITIKNHDNRMFFNPTNDPENQALEKMYQYPTTHPKKQLYSQGMFHHSSIIVPLSKCECRLISVIVHCYPIDIQL